MHITNIHAPLRGLISVLLVFFSQQPTHYAPLHPNTPSPQGIHLHWAKCMQRPPSSFVLQVSFLSSDLPLGELKVKVEYPRPGCSRSQDPPPALHLRGRKHSNICADVCSHAGTHSNNARELRNMNTQNTYTNKVLNKQININTGKRIA